MKVDRRSFLIGVSAVVAAPALASFQKVAALTGPISSCVLPSRLGVRKINELIYSCMPRGDDFLKPEWREDPVTFTFSRDRKVMSLLTMNPRGTARWVAMPGHEWKMSEGNLFRMTVEPAYAVASLTVGSNIEMDEKKPPRAFVETYKWEDGKIVFQEAAACDPADDYLLA